MRMTTRHQATVATGSFRLSSTQGMKMHQIIACTAAATVKCGKKLRSSVQSKAIPPHASGENTKCTRVASRAGLTLLIIYEFCQLGAKGRPREDLGIDYMVRDLS